MLGECAMNCRAYAKALHYKVSQTSVRGVVRQKKSGIIKRACLKFYVLSKKQWVESFQPKILQR